MSAEKTKYQKKKKKNLPHKNPLRQPKVPAWSVAQHYRQ